MIAGVSLCVCSLFAYAEPAAKPSEPTPVYEGKTAVQWVAALRENDPEVRRQALAALEKIGPSAVPALVGAVGDAEKEFRPVLAAVLRRLGPAAATAAADLEAAREEKGPVLRCRMAGRAAFFHPKTEWVLPVLLEGVRDKDKAVRSAALEEMRQLAFHAVVQGLPPGAEGAVPALAGALQDSDAAVRRLAVEALGDFGAVSGAEAAAAAAGLLKDKDAELRSAAALALAKMGAKAKSAAPALLAALEDADAAVRGRAAFALATADPAKLPEALKALRGKGEDDLRNAALAVERLEHLIRTPPEGFDAMALLTSITKDESPELRIAAAETLGRLGADGKPGLNAVLDLMRDAQPMVRMAAAMAAWRIDAALVGRTLTALTGALASPDKAVRHRACDLLGQMGPAAKPAVGALEKAAQDPEVADDALAALRRIDSE